MTYTNKIMRTTRSLSKAYTELQEEAMEKIKSFFNKKPYVRIVIDKHQNLNIDTGTQRATVTEIHSNGNIFFITDKVYRTKSLCQATENDPLPVDALLTILDELERMKKAGLLKKP